MTLMKCVMNSDGTSQNVPMSPSEEADFIATQQAMQSREATDLLLSQAQQALDKSDMVATRCFKAGIAFPSNWQSYVTTLRSIVSSGTGTIPTQPPYPQGT